MYENARKALEPRFIIEVEEPLGTGGVLKGKRFLTDAELDAIIDALRPHLIPDGCVAVCKPCAGYVQINQGDCGDECPLKPKEPK